MQAARALARPVAARLVLGRLVRASVWAPVGCLVLVQHVLVSLT
jgi:hypothetical protein